MRLITAITISVLICGTLQAGEWKVWADNDGNDTKVMAGFDFLGAKGYQARSWAKFESYPLKILQLITVPLDYASYMASEHPCQTIGLIFVASETSGKTHYTQDVIDWTSDVFEKDSKEEEYSGGTKLEIYGNSSPVVYENYKPDSDSNISIHDNTAPVTIIIGKPKPEPKEEE